MPNQKNSRQACLISTVSLLSTTPSGQYVFVNPAKQLLVVTTAEPNTQGNCAYYTFRPSGITIIGA